MLVYSSYQEYLLAVFRLNHAMHIPSLSVYSIIFSMDGALCTPEKRQESREMICVEKEQEQEHLMQPVTNIGAAEVN